MGRLYYNGSCLNLVSLIQMDMVCVATARASARLDYPQAAGKCHLHRCTEGSGLGTLVVPKYQYNEISSPSLFSCPNTPSCVYLKNQWDLNTGTCSNIWPWALYPLFAVPHKKPMTLNPLDLLGLQSPLTAPRPDAQENKCRRVHLGVSK